MFNPGVLEHRMTVNDIRKRPSRNGHMNSGQIQATTLPQKSNPMSSAGAECVSAPTAMRSTPVRAISPT